MNFEEAFDLICEHAPPLFMKDGYHIHLLLFCPPGEDKPVVLQLEHETPAQKQKMYRQLYLATRGKAEWYVQVSEAWAAPDSELRPSEHPDRREILEVNGAHRDGRHLLRSWNILREPVLDLLEEEKPLGWTGALDRVLLGMKASD